MRQDFNRFILWTAIFATLFVWVSYSWQYTGGRVGMGEEVTGLVDVISRVFPFVAPYVPTFMKVTYWIAAIGAILVALVIFTIFIRLTIRLIYKLVRGVITAWKVIVWIVTKPLIKQDTPFPVDIKAVVRNMWAYIVRVAKGEVSTV